MLAKGKVRGAQKELADLPGVGSHMCCCRVALATAGHHAYIGSKVFCQDEVLRINQSDERHANEVC